MHCKRFQSLWVAIALLVSGCMAQAISQESSAPATGEIPVMTTGTTNEGQQRRIVLKLNLSSPADLLVQQGQVVQSGETIADRVRDRDRLQARLEKVQLQIAQVGAPVNQPPPVRPVPEIAGLPPANFLAEVAEVERQGVLIESKQREITQQQRLIDMLESMPDSQVPEATIPHEQEVMAQLQRELAQVQSEYDLAQAQLSQAQAERQYLEYQHSVTVANRQIQIQQAQLQQAEQQQRVAENERERQFKLSQLEVEQDRLESELLQLSAVRAPFTGTIQRINWKGQNDRNILVEVTLIATVDGDDARFPSLESEAPEDGGGASP